MKLIAAAAALFLASTAAAANPSAAAHSAPGADAAQATHAHGAAPAHRIYEAGQVSWAAGPPSLPPGAQAAVLYGDPGKEGLFAMRLKLPAGYRIAPHTHPRPEVVTVISGAFHVGMGTVADEAKARRLPAGSLFAFDPGLAHYASVQEETVIQINSTGPWAISYVNPADDPRQKAAPAGAPTVERGGAR